MLVSGGNAGDAGAELRGCCVGDLDGAVNRGSLGQLELELKPVSNCTSEVRADLKSLLRKIEHFAGNNLSPATDLAIPFDRDSEEFALLRHVVSNLSYARFRIHPCMTE